MNPHTEITREALVIRARAEFREMPGMSLASAQARKAVRNSVTT